MAGTRAGDITYIGKCNFRGNERVFGIKSKDRRQHMYVIGKTGTGKTSLIHNMIIQDIANGEGLCVVDPHGELVESILEKIPEERMNDVVYFNPADPDFHMGFNVLELPDPRYKHLVASGLMGIFTKIWANVWSARMEYILNNAVLALLDTPDSTLLGIMRLLADKNYRQRIIENVKDPVVKAFWVNEYEEWREQFRNEAIAPIQNKVGQFLSTPLVRNIVGQPKSTIDIFEIMNSKKIFLVNVSKGRIGEDNSALLGAMLITKIQLAAMERVRIPEEDRKDFYLYVDEFQNFATDSFANILSEARKYRLNLTVAHQYTAQLENKDGSKVRDAVFGNVGTMIIFRVGADDADFLEKEFEPEFMAQDLVNLPNFHIYLKLMIDGITSRPFSASTLPPLKVDPTSGVKDAIITSSRNLYCRSRQEVEDEISKWSGMLQVGDGEAKYKADCSNCGKVTMVPFEPQEGRPVYCKECMFKIKSGELKPESGFIASRSSRQEEKVSTAPLAALGIEFAVTDTNFRVSKNHEQTNPKIPNKIDRNISTNNHVNNNYKNNHNNSSQNGNKNHFSKPERSHSGPSPLLKGLLQKIGLSNGKGETIPKVEAVEVKKEVPASMSLSDLKKEAPKEARKEFVAPVKEATEEKKASLKDLLAKTVNHNYSHEEKTSSVEAVVPQPKPEVKEEVFIPKAEEVKEEVPLPPVAVASSATHREGEKEEEVPIVPLPPKKDIEEAKAEEDTIIDSRSWQKRQVKKEVPEDVLRKVLE